MSEFSTPLIAVDFGTKRVGLAITDPERRVAVGLTTIVGKNEREVAHAISTLCAERHCNTVIMGHPALGMDRPDNNRGLLDVVSGIERVTDRLKKMDITVIWWDESCTTAQVLADRRKIGGKGARKGNWLDFASATLLLQSYLDYQKQPSNGRTAELVTTDSDGLNF